MVVDDLIYAKFAAKYVAAFFLVVCSFALTFQLIKKVADFIISVLMLLAVALACTAIYNGDVKTWPEVIGAALASGICAGLVCIPLLPFSSNFSKALSDSSKSDTPVKQD